MTRWRHGPALPQVDSPEARIYLRPIGLLSGDAAEAAIEAGAGRRLAGGRFAFTACEVLLRDSGTVTATIAPLGEVARWATGCAGATLERLSAPRPAVLGIAMDRPAIMGVINVTPTASPTAATAPTRRRPSPVAARWPRRAPRSSTSAANRPGPARTR